ncbi:hypothetical protein GCM10009847_15370 [Leucobacter tardus]|uniref:Coenzyme Q-binding protein COQ10 START domain-containing protein n=1 Tax=Leucobacter tardus TaxID=501483 RepID=A0A939QJ41_9MICO|nr:SRPBCC family protein [Leucobacter tardus]MBO2989719.1 hypothetical protein [Leucobacter tardus]
MSTDSGSAVIDLKAPISAVYQAWTRFETYPLFMHQVKGIVQISDKVLRWRVAFEDLELGFDATILDRVPRRKLSWRNLGPFLHSGRVDLRSLSEERSRIRLMMLWDRRILVDPAGHRHLVDDTRVANQLASFAKLFLDGTIGYRVPALIGGTSAFSRGPITTAHDEASNETEGQRMTRRRAERWDREIRRSGHQYAPTEATSLRRKAETDRVDLEEQVLPADFRQTESISQSD